MITELTSEQTAKMAEYRDMWIDIGLSTEPEMDKEKATEAIDRVYTCAGLATPKIKIYSKSPLSNGIIYWLLKNKKLKEYAVWDSVWASVRDSVRDSVRASVRDSVRASVGDSVGDSVRDSVWASVGDSVWASVWASVGDSVRDSVEGSVWASVGDSVWASVWDSVRASVWASVWDSVRASVEGSVWASVRDSVEGSVWASVGDSVWASVWDSVWDSVRDSVGDSCYGQHDANWLAFYNFFFIECNLTFCEKLLGLWDAAKYCNWFIPFENMVIISAKPTFLKMKNKKLHCETRSALSYGDGFEIFALNGVKVPKEIIETSAENIDPKIILKEKNAEVRREIVRKIGINRVVEKLGSKTLDKVGDYELLNLNIGDGRSRPFLKMLNPSVGTWHIEGVHPECDTVEKALAFRNQTTVYIKPQILT